MSHVNRLSRDILATLLSAAPSSDESVNILMSLGGLCEPPSILRQVNETYEKFSMDGSDVVWNENTMLVRL